MTPDLTHVTEIGNYTTTAIPTYQLIDVCFWNRKNMVLEIHRDTKGNPLFSRNLVNTCAWSIGLASSEHDGFKRSGGLRNA